MDGDSSSAFALAVNGLIDRGTSSALILAVNGGVAAILMHPPTSLGVVWCLVLVYLRCLDRAQTKA